MAAFNSPSILAFIPNAGLSLAKLILPVIETGKPLLLLNVITTLKHCNWVKLTVIVSWNIK